jgi:hypothetical protein
LFNFQGKTDGLRSRNSTLFSLTSLTTLSGINQESYEITFQGLSPHQLFNFQGKADGLRSRNSNSKEN